MSIACRKIVAEVWPCGFLEFCKQANKQADKQTYSSRCLVKTTTNQNGESQNGDTKTAIIMYCNYVLYAVHNPTISCRRFGFRRFSLSPLWPCLLSPFRHVAVFTVNPHQNTSHPSQRRSNYSYRLKTQTLYAEKTRTVQTATQSRDQDVESSARGRDPRTRPSVRRLTD